MTAVEAEIQADLESDREDATKTAELKRVEPPVPMAPSTTLPLVSIGNVLARDGVNTAVTPADPQEDITQLMAASRVPAGAPKAPGEATEEPRVSIVIPGLNESESLEELERTIRQALEGVEKYEIIFVDDGSTDNSWKMMCRMGEKDPRVRAVRLRKNFGKAMGLSAGFSRARGEVVVMMDADLQDDPAELHKFIAKIDAGFDVVVGWKVKRYDPTNRLILTRIFNATVRYATGVKLHDMNCGFKAFKREVIKTVPVYGDLFRFIPVLANWEGFKVTEVPITHHARKHGSSRYGLERVMRGFFDLLSISFLTKYSRRPMHLFGLLGLILAGIGLIIDFYLSILWIQGQKIGDRPLLVLGSLLIFIGVQFFSMGFIVEFLTYINQKSLKTSDLPIREETQRPRRPRSRATLS